MNVLINAKASLDIQGQDGKSALIWGNVQDFEIINFKYQIFALIGAQYGFLSIVTALVNNGSNINIKDNNGKTALMWGNSYFINYFNSITNLAIYDFK